MDYLFTNVGIMFYRDVTNYKHYECCLSFCFVLYIVMILLGMEYMYLYLKRLNKTKHYYHV